MHINIESFPLSMMDLVHILSPLGDIFLRDSSFTARAVFELYKIP